MSLWHYVNDDDEVISASLCPYVLFAHVRVIALSEIGTGRRLAHRTTLVSSSISTIHIMVVHFGEHFYLSELKIRGDTGRGNVATAWKQRSRKKISWQFFVFGRRPWYVRRMRWDDEKTF